MSQFDQHKSYRRGRRIAADSTGGAATVPAPGRAEDDRQAAKAAQRGAVDTLHREFFAEAGALAARYGVTFDRVLMHLTDLDAGRSIERVEHVADLIHAIACVDRVGMAWADLSEQYEPLLVQSVESRLGRADAVLVVRRLLTDLRHAANGERLAGMMPLQRYAGHMSLTKWLSVRLAARLCQRHQEQARLVQRIDAFPTTLPRIGIGAPAATVEAKPMPAFHHADRDTCVIGRIDPDRMR